MAKKKVKRSSPKRTIRRRSSAPRVKEAPKALPFEVDPNRIEESLRKLREQVVHWANKGRYTRVRFKFRGKQLLPDLPLAAVLAAEGLTFYWGGILRALIFNLAGKAIFEVELVNDAEKRIQHGKEELLRGDVAGAIEHFRAAISMDGANANAHLNVGIALKISGDIEGARKSLEQAKALDKGGTVAQEADRLLSSIKASNSAVNG
jgi:tetratricopeptide (TPR) repeat protein